VQDFLFPPQKKVCILYSGYCEKDGNPNWEFYLEESCKGDLEIGISLKEYQKQVDIFKKDIGDQHRAIEKLTEELRSQDALLDNQRSLIQGLKQNVSTMKGDLAEEMQHRKASDSAITGNVTDAIRNVNGRVDTLENTAVRSCSQDSDCSEPLHFCLNGWCSVVECTTDSHCTSSSKPKCYNNICECRSSDDCNYNNPVCDNGTCIHCNGKWSCTAQQPYCVNDGCVECQLDSDCNADQVCTMTNTCHEACNSDSDCWLLGSGSGLIRDHVCASGHCYNYMYPMLCGGSRIETYTTLGAAREACSADSSCGCIHDYQCDGGQHHTYVGTSTKPDSGFGSCAWVKP